MCKHPMPKGLRFAILQKTIRRQMDEYVRETGLTGTQVGVLGELGRLEREEPARSRRRRWRTRRTSRTRR